MNPTTDTPRTDAQKWCAYCGVWGDHQSGYCVPFLRDREVTLTHQLADARLEVERLRANLRRAIEIAEILNRPFVTDARSNQLRNELDQLK